MKLSLVILVSLTVFFSLSDSFIIKLRPKDKHKKKPNSVNTRTTENNRQLLHGLPLSKTVNNLDQKLDQEVNKDDFRSTDRIKGSCGLNIFQTLTSCLLTSYYSAYEPLSKNNNSRYSRSYEHSESSGESRLESSAKSGSESSEEYVLESAQEYAPERLQEPGSESIEEDHHRNVRSGDLKGVPAHAVCLLHAVMDYAFCAIAEGSAASNNQVRLNYMDDDFNNNLTWEWVVAGDGHF